MAEAAKRYLYRGRVLGVWQFLSSLEWGIRSQDGAGIGSSSYRSVKNSELGRYGSRDEAQRALDAFALKKRLTEVDRNGRV